MILAPHWTSNVVRNPVDPDDLRGRIQSRPGTVYAILDACDQPLVPPKVAELGERAACLYEKQAAEDFAMIAPYLARVDEPLFDWIQGNLWDEAWGLFLVAEVELAKVRQHLRRFLVFVNDADRKLFFRFYDMRALEVYLATCTPREALRFFGPIRQLYGTTEDRVFECWDPPAERDLRPAPFSGPHLRVSGLQLDRMALYRQLHFQHRLWRHLRQLSDSKGCPRTDAEIEQVVTRAVDVCPYYRLSRQRDVARFAEILCLHARHPDAELPLPARNILFDHRVDADTKLDRFEAWVKG